MATKRSALLIGASNFESPEFKQLRSPARDISDLATILKDPKIGDFEVDTSLDENSYEVGRSIESFFSKRGAGDLLLLHLSTHGLRADDGALFFASRNTDRNLLASTAISAEFLQRQMGLCRAKTIILLLDCCYSGAFLAGIKGDPSIEIKDQLHGHGRAVLTASNRTEYAWEGDHLNELEPEPSHFSGSVIEGLRSGDADRNRDGKVTIDELYDYVHDRMRSKTKLQTPQKWTALEYEVIVARSPFAPEQAETSVGAESENAVSLTPVISQGDMEPVSVMTTDPGRRVSTVAHLKRALPDPVRRIETFDIVDRVVTEVLESSSQEKRPVIGPMFAENIRGYRADSDILLHLLAVGVFHDDGSHDAIWVRVVERLGRLRNNRNISRFNEELDLLRLYPALLATWAMGIAAVLGRREDFLARLFMKPKLVPPFGNEGRQRPARYLNPVYVIRDSINELCNPGNGGNYYYPQSHYLRKELRDPFREIEPDDATYAEACSRFELLASMIAIDANVEFPRPWPGEYLLDSNWGYGEDGLAWDIGHEISPTWPLIAAGAFNGDVSRAEEVLKALVEYRSRTPHW